MKETFSRRQIIRLGGGFLGGVASAGLLNKAAVALNMPPRERLIDPRLFPRTRRVPVSSSKPSFYTQGRHLYSPNGTKVILRGVNFPLLDDWGFPASDTLAELEKTGANAVRIQWYKDYEQTSRPAFSLADLDRILTKCQTLKMIPIVYLSDLTCQSDPNLLNVNLMPWWTSTEVVTMLKKHEKYLIVNLANELGHYRWAGSSDGVLNTFKDAYKTAIVNFRQTGLRMPIAIDAPDCGSTIEVFPRIAQELINADPQKNLLFSGHAYWAAYNGIPQIQAAINANIPLFLGEIANKQDENSPTGTLYCHYDLDGGNTRPAQNNFTYQNLLTQLKQQEIGWLAWTWWKDGCSPRQMTNDGTIANLTPYGNDIVNNPNYGLKATATRLIL
jgi:mannan endo-1,4-beta-mannosidase